MIRKIDLVLRFAYVVLIPTMLAVFALLMSVTGLVITAALGTAIAVFGTEAWRDRVGTIPVIGGFLANMARLGEYYEEHPPKLLVYYIFYPLLFPYWLIKRSARREFLLYRRLSAIVLVFALVGGTINYFTRWYPDIPFNMFFGSMVGLLVLQLLITFSVIMPIVTTVVIYHQRKLKATLIVVLALGLVTGVPMYYVMHKTPSFLLVGFETRQRIKERTKARPAEAKVVMQKALVEAAQAFARTKDNHEVLAAMRERLKDFYLADEANAFMIWHDRAGRQLLIMARPDTRKPAIAWAAADAKGAIEDADKLVPELRNAIGL